MEEKIPLRIYIVPKSIVLLYVLIQVTLLVHCCDESLVNYGGLCLSRCPADMFQVEFTDQCVSSCPDYAPYSYETFCVEFCPPGYMQYYDNRCNISYDLHFHNNPKINCPSNFCPKSRPYCYNLICKEHCPEGTFAENFNCVQSCDDEFQYIYNSSCVKECPENMLYTQSNHCVTSCPRETFQHESKCVLLCPESTVTFNWTCTPKCPSEYPFSMVYGKGKRCLRECPFYTSINGSICQPSCPRQELFIYNRTCVLKCPDESPYILIKDVRVFNGEVIPVCVQRCPEDHYLDEDVCVYSCDADKFILNSICVSVCPYLYDMKNRRCVDQCLPGTYMLNNTCVSLCPQGTFISNAQCTSSCPSNEPFVDKYSYPIRCVSKCPAYTYRYSCVRHCPVKTYYLNSTCIDACPRTHSIIYGGRCVNKCSEFYPFNETNRCSYSCNQSRVIFNGTCYNECPVTYPYINHHLLRLTCLSSCPKDKVIMDNKCLTECPNSTFFTVEKECNCNFSGNSEKCHHNCSLDRKQCVIKCPAKMLYHGKQCVNSCPRPLYAENNTCKTQCELHPYMMNNLCVSKCPDDYFVSEKACIKRCSESHPYRKSSWWDSECLKSCKDVDMINFNYTCIGKQYCSKQLKMKVYNNQTCVSECPIGSVLSSDSEACENIGLVQLIIITLAAVVFIICITVCFFNFKDVCDLRRSSAKKTELLKDEIPTYHTQFENHAFTFDERTENAVQLNEYEIDEETGRKFPVNVTNNATGVHEDQSTSGEVNASDLYDPLNLEYEANEETGAKYLCDTYKTTGLPADHGDSAMQLSQFSGDEHGSNEVTGENELTVSETDTMNSANVTMQCEAHVHVDLHNT